MLPWDDKAIDVAIGQIMIAQDRVQQEEEIARRFIGYLNVAIQRGQAYIDCSQDATSSRALQMALGWRQQRNESEWAACGLVSLWTALKLLGQNCIDPQELIDFSDDPEIAVNGATEKQLEKIAKEFGCHLERFKFRNDFEKAWGCSIQSVGTKVI